MSPIQLPWFGADDIARLRSPGAAIAAIQDALRAGLDPASDPARGGLMTLPTKIIDGVLHYVYGRA